MVTKQPLLGPWLALDTETTAPDPEVARVVDICTAHVDPASKKTRKHTALINPGIEIPAEAVAIHGITNERIAKEGKPAREVLDVFVGEIALAVHRGTPLVAQNAVYDLTVLDRECRRYDLPTLEDRVDGDQLVVLDPLVLDRYLIRFRRRVSKDQGARVLKTLAQVYGIPWDDDLAHGAEYDTMVTARVVWRMGQWTRLSMPELLAIKLGPFTPPTAMRRDYAMKFQEVGALTGAGLHEAQKVWYEEQTEGLVQFWRKTATELRDQAAEAEGEESADIALQDAADLDRRIASCSFDWPVRPFVEPVDAFATQGALL